MSTRKSASAPARLPGNDANWYLKAVGVDATLTGLSDVELETESTSELVKVLWEFDGPGDDLGQWAPDDLNRTMQRKRNFRWTVVLAGVLVVAAVVALAVWLPSTSERRADAVAVDYENSLSALLGDLLPAQQTLAVITELDADVSQFPAEVPIIAALRADAEASIDLAGDPLPRAWPLASTEPFEALMPFRDALSREGTTAESIARRLGNVLEYRSLGAGLLATGTLPAEAADVDLTELTTRLATVAADSASVLGELPDDAALATHATEAREAVERFSQWQVEYVDALRNGDAEAVELLVSEFETSRADLDRSLTRALGVIRGEIDAEIIALASQIETTMTELAAR